MAKPVNAEMQAQVTAVWIDMCTRCGTHPKYHTLARLAYALVSSDAHKWLGPYKTTSTDDSRRWFRTIFAQLQIQDPAVASAKKPAHDAHTWSDVAYIWRALNGSILEEESDNRWVKLDPSFELIRAAGTDLLRSLPIDIDAVLATPLPPMPIEDEDTH